MNRRKWWMVAAILWMAVIFMFTQVPYSTGKNTSDTLQKILMFLHIDGVNHAVVDQLNFFVRKLTHITVFGFLAFLFFKCLEVYRFAYILAWILTVLYAMTDEYHQSFMPGRTASIKDVFLFDSVGAFLVLLVTFLIVRKTGKKTRSRIG